MVSKTLHSEPSEGDGFGYYFRDLKDPRDERYVEHDLYDVLILVVLGVICGADGFVEVELFGRSKEALLRKFLKLRSGIPSHDTLGRVFSVLDPSELRRCFIQWTQSLSQKTEGRVIAIDGKTLRSSHDEASNKSALHMVSAFCVNNRLVLGQLATDMKSNEITAIPKLLKLLDIKGSIITIDAMGTQTKIADQIIEQGADYILALKGNQGSMHKDVQQRFEWAEKKGYQPAERFVARGHHPEAEKDHGRIEERIYTAMKADDWLVDKHPAWKTVKSVIQVQSSRMLKEQTSTEKRYYISSLPYEELATVITPSLRGHWCIESDLHWSLDVTFKEDLLRNRVGNCAENFAVSRHIAFNLLKQSKTIKAGIKAKRLKAALDEDYLLNVIQSTA